MTKKLFSSSPDCKYIAWLSSCDKEADEIFTKNKIKPRILKPLTSIVRYGRIAKGEKINRAIITFHDSQKIMQHLDVAVGV